MCLCGVCGVCGACVCGVWCVRGMCVCGVCVMWCAWCAMVSPYLECNFESCMLYNETSETLSSRNSLPNK